MSNQPTNPELQESVLVVPREIAGRLCPRVFCSETGQAEKEVLQHCRFLPRTTAEHDFRFKQVIPYVVIRHAERYLLMRRTRKQTESRLHDLYSLGVGGHINNGDDSGRNGSILITGMRRELAEEIRLEAEASCRLVGLINDDSNEVSRVHMGFVYLLTASSPGYTIMEPDKYTAQWGTPAEISGHYSQMESWAQIVHDHMLSAKPA